MKKNTASKGKTGFVVALTIIFIFSGVTLYNYWKFKIQKKEEVQRASIIPVETAPAQLKRLAWILEQTGDICPMQEVTVQPKISGKIILNIYVEKGDLVKKGELLASLEDETIKAQIRESEAALSSANAKLTQVEAQLDLIKKDRIRIKKLVKTRAMSQQKLDQINSRYKVTLAGKKLALSLIERAHSSLNLLKILHKDHQIVSPIAGCISARFVDQGSMSDAKKPIVRVSSEKAVKITTSVSEQDYPYIKKEMKAEISVDAFPQKTFQGAVAVINPTLDPATRTGEIEIYVPNEDLVLRSGMFANIRLQLGNREALTIDKDGLLRLPGTGSYYVYTVENDRASLKNIKIGMVQEDFAEIKEGLKADAQVIIKGQNRVKDGMDVKVKQLERKDP